MQLAAFAFPISTSLSPGEQGRSKNSWRWGLRISASSRRTRLPAKANATAVLYATVDFPSPKSGLVTRSVRSLPAWDATWIAVRKERNDSALADRGSLINGLDSANMSPLSYFELSDL